MALVHDSAGDFVLFPRDRVIPDLPAQSFASHFDNFYHSSTAMDYHSQFAASTRTTYDSHPVTTSYATPATYYEVSKSHLNSLKAGDEGSMPRPTPSASPSSLSQTFDQPPSVLSSTSGASAQSAASSVGGSPYTRPTQQMPFHDKWSDQIQGLGISPGVASREYLGYHPSHQDFVGEYQDVLTSSLSVTGPPVSSISLAPGLQESCSSYSVPRSGLPAKFHTKEMALDAIHRDVKYESPHSTCLVSPPSPRWTTDPPSLCPVITQDVESQTEHTPFPPRYRDPISATPQPLSQSPARSIGRSIRRNSLRTSLTPLSTSSVVFPKHQDPLFGQSSGRFVAPLHSSCWFSFAS